MTQRRIKELLAKQPRRIRDRFRQVMQRVRDRWSPSELETAISEGRLSEYLDDIERAAGEVAGRVAALQVAVAHETTEYVARQADKLVSYDTTNSKAVEVLRANRIRLVAGITEHQRGAIVDVLSAQTAAGVNPRQQAVKIRDVLGLTRRQAAAVTAYRDRLEGEATPLNADVPEGEDAPKPAKARTAAQIDRMVERHAARQVKQRAEALARTEVQSALNEGQDIAFGEAIKGGAMEAADLQCKWLAGKPPRTRPFHAVMNGQIRKWGELFVDGLGNQLRFPGDPNAPAATRRQCRCGVARRIVRKPATVAKRSPVVIMIAGASGTGKSTLAKAMAAELGLPVLPTDDFIGMGWSEASQYVADLIADGAARIVEGVAVPRALRKALAARTGVKPCDRLIVLTTPRREQTPKQVTQGKGALTVLDAIIPALLELGVVVDVRAG